MLPCTWSYSKCLECLANTDASPIFKSFLHADKPSISADEASPISKPAAEEASQGSAAWDHNGEEADWDEEERDNSKPDPLGSLFSLRCSGNS